MAQVRCPNCGGYRVSNERTRMFLNDWGGPYSFAPLVATFGSWIALGVIAAIIGNNASNVVYGVLIVAGFAVSLIGGIVWLIRVNGPKASMRAKPIFHHHYTCALCGYKWSWREDQPQPQATQPANTELIERGEQQRRNAAAVAAHEEQLRRDRERRDR